MNTILKLKLKELLAQWMLSDYISIVDTDVKADGAYVKVFVKKELLTDKEKLKKRIIKQISA